jgi:hypothetical protein
MKWLLTALVALDFGARSDVRQYLCPTNLRLEAVGSLSNIALSTPLHSYEHPVYSRSPIIDNLILAQKLVDAWAWLFFALNTSMTMSIIYKIL